MQGKPSIDSPTEYWSKLDREDPTAMQWHPLAAHCADVGACAEALLGQTLLRKRLARLGGRDDLTEQDVARLCVLACWHDLGKCNHGFQRKAEDASVKGPRAGHVREFLALLACESHDLEREQKRLREVLPIDDMYDWADEGDDGDECAGMRLLVASIGHHGRPARCDELPVAPSLWRKEMRDPLQEIALLVQWTRQWYSLAFAPSTSRLPGNAEFQHAFAGLVMLADWLGSDTRLFKFAEDQGDRMPVARAASRRALRLVGLDVQLARVGLGEGVPGFDKVSPYPPREVQAKVMALPLPSKGGMAILESETGSGKTEAAIGRFVQLFHAGLVDGMYFALPTRTAATQIHARVCEAMERAFPSPEERPPVVLAVPGYLQFDDVRGTLLSPFHVLWDDDPKAERRYRGWAAEQPKRYLAGSVVVGTIDQALLSSLRTGHSHLRATALLRHLLVVDEVHASDAYMNRILEHVLAFHVAAGGHAFLMSATLGADTRARLTHAACVGVYKPVEGPSLNEALQTPYPAVHDVAPGMPAEVVAVQHAGLPKKVCVELLAKADHPQQVVSLVLEAARHGARVLVLRNTVTDAVATQIALEEACGEDDAGLLFRVGEVVTLHTARFSKMDRGLLDEAIERRFGKDAPQLGGAVVVATQTVQQSLDLDADLLLTDLAPMDVLLQRIGRVHRHRDRDSHRPTGFERPKAVVLTSEKELSEVLDGRGAARGDHGVGTVYDNVLVLEATRRLLESSPEIAIPEQNREMVERSTHPEVLSRLAEDLGGNWQEHHNAVQGKGCSHKGMASINMVDRRKLFGEYAFQIAGMEEKIASRLGESDRIAVFTEKPRGPFGGVVDCLTIPGWLVRGANCEADEVPVVTHAGVGPVGQEIRFAMGKCKLVYDRLGLRRDGEAAEDDVADA